LKVFAAEFVAFAIDFILFAVEFASVTVEFIQFTIKFIVFAVEFVRIQSHYSNGNKPAAHHKVDNFIMENALEALQSN